MPTKQVGNGRDKATLNAEAERETLVADAVAGTGVANNGTDTDAVCTVAEHDLLVTAINSIIAALQAQGLMKAS